jgi:hypothetical protein
MAMLVYLLIISLRLITLTGPDGQLIELNPDTVATIRTVRGTDHFAAATRCIVFTTDGKNVNVTETCAKVHELLEQAK